MRVLLDSCVTGKARAVVEAADHDVIWVGDWPRDPGDEQILRIALSESRIVVTIDKDFGELAIARGIEHCGLIRLVGFRAKEQGTMIIELLAKYAEELQAASIVTADRWRVRVRRK
jgi:predicted nuclease of predicted toxin-antitoxin system